MGSRKGTIEILKAIKLLPNEDLSNKCFIFAGKIFDDIKVEFYKLLEVQKQRVQILCFDKFCEFSFFGSLCISSDYILLPYKATAQSSGVIGYGAQFNVPVVVPDEKLLGKLVRRYNLGYLIKNCSPTEIADFILRQRKSELKIDGSKYLEDNNLENFNKIIFENI